MGLFEDLQSASFKQESWEPDKPQLTPEEASQTYQTAAAYDTPVEEVTEDMRRQHELAKVFSDTGDVFKDSMRNPIFQAAIRGDEKSASSLESAVAAVVGDQVDVDDTSLSAVAKKSAARGIIGTAQMANMTQLLSLRQGIKDIEDRFVSGTADENDRTMYYAAEKRIRRLASDIVKNDAMRKVLAVNSPTEKMGEAYEKDGLLGALGAAGDAGVGATMADVGTESAVEYGAAAPAIAMAGKVPLLGQILTGATSAYQDFMLGMLDRMAEHGVDTSKADSVADFILYSPEFGDVMQGGAKHAAGVGVFDALSFGLATKMIPTRLGSSVAAKMPKTAQAYEAVNKSIYGRTFANLGAQSVAQGAMGMAGEASGQLLEKGEVTDGLSVMLEGIGQFSGAPLEVATAAVGARSRARYAAAKAERVQSQLKAAAQIIQSSPAMQKTPELRDALMSNIGARYEGAESIVVDIASLAQADDGPAVVDAIAKILPARRAELEEAIEAGGTVELPLDEYGRVIADASLSDTVVGASSLNGDDLAVEAKEAESSVLAAKKFSVSAYAEGQSPEFRASLLDVAKQAEAVIGEGGKGERTEHAAILSLMMAQVSAMAQDAGMTPTEVWENHGLKAVLGEADVQRTEDGKIIPVSDKAKAVLPQGATFEPSANGRQNKGDFIPEAGAVVRWANADRSTLLHETGHWFWQARLNLALRLKQNEALSESQQSYLFRTEAVAKWLGFKDIETYAAASFDAKRAAEEKFARSYEQYLKEGRAPSGALRSAFQKFSAWLKKIYGVLTAVRGSELTPEVRELFDAIMVSSQQVQEAQLRRHLFTWMDTAARGEDGSLDKDAERRALNVLMADTDAAANEAFLARGKATLDRVRRIRQRVYDDFEKKAKEVRAQLTAEEIAATFGERRLAASNKIDEGIAVHDKKGRSTRIRPQITLKELQAAGATEAQIVEFKRQKLVTGSEGLHAVPGDYLAEFAGYTSLSEFINEFGSDPFHGEEPAKVVAERVEARMADEHPELLDHETIEEAADAAVFNPTATQFALAKANLIDASIKRKPLTMDLIDAVAEARLRDLPIGDLKPVKYRNEASGLSSRAMKEKDTWKASELRRQQLVAMKTAEKAQEVKDRLNRFVDKMQKRFDGRIEASGMQLEYLKQIKEILCNLRIIERDSTINPPAKPRNPDMKAMAWEDFFAEESQCVDMPSMPETLTGIASFDMLTVQEAQQAMEFMDKLMAAARERNTLVVNGKKMQINDLDDAATLAITKHMEEIGKKGVSQNAQDGFRLRMERAWNRFLYDHLRIQTFWAMLEGEQLGHLGEAFGLRMNSARDKETELRNKYAVAMAKAMEPLDKAASDTKKIYIEELGGSFTKRQLIAIALNCGNDENMTRLLEGSAKGYKDFRGDNETPWTRKDVLTAVGTHLTREEILAVQNVWDTVGSLGGDLHDLDARTRNRWTEMVKPREVVFLSKGGEATVALKGGYYPIQYDRYASMFSGKADAFENGLNAIQGRNTRNSDTGHSKARTGGRGNPIELTLDAGFSALTDVIHDLCWRELLMDMNKLFNSRSKVTKAIQTYRGKEMVNSIKEWIRDVATNGKSIPSNYVVNFMRRNVSIAGLGFNPMTAALQPIGMTQSLAVIGAKAAFKGMGMYLRNMRRANQTVLAKSAMMRDRMRTRFKELAEVQRTIGRHGKLEELHKAVGRTAFVPLVFTQVQLVDIPTWLGSYDKHCTEGEARGLSGVELENYAVARADDDVVRAQGSGALSDLSKFERQKDIWNVFYSFFGTALNAGMLILNTQKGARKWISLGAMLLIQPMIESGLRTSVGGATSDTDEDFWDRYWKRAVVDVASMNLGLFLYLREVGGLVADELGGTSRDYGGPAGTRMISDAGKMAHQLIRLLTNEDAEFGKSMVKATIALTGDLAGIPSTQFNRIVDTLDAVNEGEDVNVPMSLLFGYKKD